ncbi:MAG: acetyl-CoA carboxylase [Liquorilactobacillus ghanensis]|uniref:hypothetical protein n=1 Tax=Liquorilactobacillus ghanensis TaxID=399370 RepID=UPI00070EBA25
MVAIPLNNSQKSHNEARLISRRITQYFKPHIKARYQILVVNNKFDQTFNFFFELQQPPQLPHSFPLHRVTHYDLAYLEEIIKQLQSEYGFTFTFRNFTGLFWPNAQQAISVHHQLTVKKNLIHSQSLTKHKSE